MKNVNILAAAGVAIGYTAYVLYGPWASGTEVPTVVNVTTECPEGSSPQLELHEKTGSILGQKAVVATISCGDTMPTAYSLTLEEATEMSGVSVSGNNINIGAMCNTYAPLGYKTKTTDDDRALEITIPNCSPR